MTVNFAGQTLFIWKITVTSKFDSIFNHPESDHQVSYMAVWVIRKVHFAVSGTFVLWYWYVRYNALILEQKKTLQDYTSFSVTMLDWIRLEVGK